MPLPLPPRGSKREAKKSRSSKIVPSDHGQSEKRGENYRAKISPSSPQGPLKKRSALEDVTNMSENIDWLHSHTDVCKVDLYSPKVEKEQDPKVDAGGSGSGGNVNLEKLKEKEIIVIKDTEKQDSSKLPEVSAKAAEKGYSVGDLPQEVINFAKERQVDEAKDNVAKDQLLDWLLTNL
uniref:A-kinase anchor 110kDa C-terminal domain-containing protein n=1 Tax=Rhinolophus ferrumequinum TaxID=59479 RepID=A0A671DUF4_RHIFE